MTPFAELSPPYATIVADPPWSYSGSTYNGRTSPWRSTSTKSYSLMSIADIARLPVGELATPDAHLYLWAVNPLMHRAFEVVKAWGFIHDTVLTWCKPALRDLAGTHGAWVTNPPTLVCHRKQRQHDGVCG